MLLWMAWNTSSKRGQFLHLDQCKSNKWLKRVSLADWTTQLRWSGNLTSVITSEIDTQARHKKYAYSVFTTYLSTHTTFWSLLWIGLLWVWRNLAKHTLSVSWALVKHNNTSSLNAFCKRWTIPCLHVYLDLSANEIQHMMMTTPNWKGPYRIWDLH